MNSSVFKLKSSRMDTTPTDNANNNNRDNGETNLGFEPDEQNSNARTNEPTANEKLHEHKRDNWGKSVEFLLSCIAMSVGLGNIWRFPVAALKNGGGAFVIPYLIVLFLVGRPIYFMEMILGQFSSRGCIKMYDFAPAFKGIGSGQVVSVFLVSTYYCSILAIAIRYLYESFKTVLPWAVCNVAWTDVFCQPSKEIEAMHPPNVTSVASAALYFDRDIIHQKYNIDDGLGDINWILFGCLALAWGIIFLITFKGIRSSGKAAYVLACFPYIVLIILLIRTVTLPGSGEGMLYFINPKWEAMLNYQVWFDAVTQVFFSLNICFGCISMYASYNKFDHKLYRDVNIINILDTCTSLLAGCITFGILGHISHITGHDHFSTVLGGPGLTFISYPDALAKFSFVPQLFAVLFFLMLLTLGFGSIISMIACVMTAVRDKFPKIRNWQAAMTMSILGFLVGIMYVTPGGLHILDIVDFFGAQWVTFVFCIAELIAVFYVYGSKRFYKDVKFMLGFSPNWMFKICWQFITPAIMLAIFIYTMIGFQLPKYNDQFYPTGVYIFGWILTAVCLIQLPTYAIIRIVKQNGVSITDKIKKAFSPLNSWGPKDYKLKIAYEEMIASQQKPTV